MCINPRPPHRKKERTGAPISLVKVYKSERALRAPGLSAIFWNSLVCFMVLMNSSGASSASRLGVVENVRKA